MKRLTFVSMGIVTILVLATVSANAELIVHLKCDETSGTTAADSSGKGNPATLQFGTNWDTSGKANGAVLLDGLNDYVSVADTAALKYSGGNLTFGAWVNISSEDTDGGRLISKPTNGDGVYNYMLAITPENKVELVVQEVAMANCAITSTEAITTGAWHHIVGVLDSSKNMKVYIDGQLKASGAHTYSTWNAPDANVPMAIGTLFPYGSPIGWMLDWEGNSGFSLKGKIDDVQIYTDALSGEQVSYLYNHPGTTLVPEPTSMALLLSGVLGLLAYAWRKRK